MERKRVVVSGIGLVTPIGIGIKDFWGSILQGKSGISFVDKFDTSKYRCKVAGQINNFDPQSYLKKQDLNAMDRSSQLGIAAVSLALEDSGLESNEYYGCYCGVGVGGADYGERCYLKFRKEPDVTLKHFFIGNVPNGLLVNICSEFPFFRKSLIVSNGCTTSTDSIGFAFKTLSLGLSKEKIIFAGGAEAPITPYTTAAFDNIRALSPYNGENPGLALRPFDINRNGFVASEGAGFLVLEELEHALSRNAKIYAEIVGYSFSTDAYHMTQPHPECFYSAKAMFLALDDADISPNDIGYLNAHGSSTKLNDKIETGVIKKVFGKYSKKLPISSTKSMIGHMLGAAGVVEIATTILGMHNSVLPPTINYEDPDPECDLYYIPNKAVEKEMRYALSNSAGFGGLNSVVILKKYEKK